jgi:MGT family glycosyltransferase
VKKVFFISLPAVAVHKTLLPLACELAVRGYAVIYYNGKEFAPQHLDGLEFRPYPDYANGYHAGAVDEKTSYFQFAEILQDTALSLIDFLVAEIDRERPDGILHSHLALWGKLLAVGLFTTFVLDEKIMVPHFRQAKGAASFEMDSIVPALNFNRSMQQLYSKLGLKITPNIWDAYVNEEALNISFILEDFQPRRELLDAQFRYVGFPGKKTAGRTRHIIYVSMGTIFNKDGYTYDVCVDVLRHLPYSCIFSVGKHTAWKMKGGADHIRIERYVDQVEVLEQSLLFITHGGSISVMEAVYAMTPMIVIPRIPEQVMLANTIEALGIGIHLPPAELTTERVNAAVESMVLNRHKYVAAMQKLSTSIPSIPPHAGAFEMIHSYFENTSLQDYNAVVSGV